MDYVDSCSIYPDYDGYFLPHTTIQANPSLIINVLNGELANISFTSIGVQLANIDPSGSLSFRIAAGITIAVANFINM
jgi:hypothetical protein